MSLQRKCLTASAITHGLLLLLVFIGSAFIPQQKPPINAPEFELVNIPLDLVEEANVISGNPNTGEAESAPAVKPPSLIPPRPVAPQPVTPKPQVPVKQPIKTPEPTPEPEKVTKQPVKPAPEPEAFDLSKAKIIKSVPKPEKPEQTFDLSQAKKKTIKISPDNTSTKTDARAAEREAQLAKVNDALEGAMKAVANTGTRVGISYSDVIGPGGKAQMSYDLAVAKIFEREFQRRPIPSRGNDPVVEVEVTIRRDGSASGHIVKRSGRAQLDRTVQDVLKNVKKVMPFPSDFKSETRTIRINFNLDETNNG